MNRRRSIAGAMLVAGGLVLLAPGAAGADPAGPTDYETEIISVEPEVVSIELDVIGGDSFLQLTSTGSHAIDVLGYRGEPYLRFQPDGIVLRNERSPSRWLNDDRFGDAELPAIADPDAAPDWVDVADEGRYAWHDHRAHWMNTSPPPGADPGDVILEAVVPLVVDGEDVTVSVRSTLVQRPTMVPAGGAALIAALAVLAIGRTRRLTAVLLGVAIASAAAGLVAYRSVPPETGPSMLLWALPAVAALSATIAAAVGTADPKRALLVSGLQMTAAAELVVWAIARSDALRRAVIPSEFPPTLDRIVIAVAGSAGAVAIVVATASLLSIIREPDLAPRSAR